MTTSAMTAALTSVRHIAADRAKEEPGESRTKDPGKRSCRSCATPMTFALLVRGGLARVEAVD